ncbi:MAG TPA: glycogen-binding domain-containing protein [Verrucomicrobiae bacterium]|jgi:1,4-alpha-glucan branching enzyme
MAKAATKTQTFHYRAPEAISVMLAGDFTHWQQRPIAMHRESGGVWTAAVSLTPGMHHYRFIVDGEWRDDPECTVRVPNGLGTQNSVVQVGR